MSLPERSDIPQLNTPSLQEADGALSGSGELVDYVTTEVAAGELDFSTTVDQRDFIEITVDEGRVIQGDCLITEAAVGDGSHGAKD